MKKSLLGLLLLLGGCSGVSSVCDKQGVCLETWRNMSLMSSVTVGELKTAQGTVVPDTTSAIADKGIISYIDPIGANLASSSEISRNIKAVY